MFGLIFIQSRPTSVDKRLNVENIINSQYSKYMSKSYKNVFEMLEDLSSEELDRLYGSMEEASKDEENDALASSSKVIMLQNAIYSVISPEGCATILWRDPKKTLEASTAMKLSSRDLLSLNIIDEIIEEPVGGAHRDKEIILKNVKKSLQSNLELFENLKPDEILSERKNKFLSIGRSKGFKSSTKDNESLSMKETFIAKYIKKFSKEIKIAVIAMVVLIIVINFFI